MHQFLLLMMAVIITASVVVVSAIIMRVSVSIVSRTVNPNIRGVINNGSVVDRPAFTQQRLAVAMPVAVIGIRNAVSAKI